MDNKVVNRSSYGYYLDIKNSADKLYKVSRIINDIKTKERIMIEEFSYEIRKDEPAILNFFEKLYKEEHDVLINSLEDWYNKIFSSPLDEKVKNYIKKNMMY
jgi:hypothetical protein